MSLGVGVGVRGGKGLRCRKEGKHASNQRTAVLQHSLHILEQLLIAGCMPGVNTDVL